MRAFWNTKDGLESMSEWQSGCWTQITCPVEDDVKFLEENLNFPIYFLSDIADADERARYDYDDGWLMIIIRVPYFKNTVSRTPYTTIPLGIIIKNDTIITVCHYEAMMMEDFISHQKKRNMGFSDASDLVFRLFLSSAVWYLKYLKRVNSMIEIAKRNLDRQIDNKDGHVCQYHQQQHEQRHEGIDITKHHNHGAYTPV